MDDDESDLTTENMTKPKLVSPKPNVIESILGQIQTAHNNLVSKVKTLESFFETIRDRMDLFRDELNFIKERMGRVEEKKWEQ